MTKWLKAIDPQSMLALLRDKVSDRKLRLFAVACCRMIWHEMNEPSRQAVDATERFADGVITDEVREAAQRSAAMGLGRTTRSPASRAAHACAGSKPLLAAIEVSNHAVGAGNLRPQREEQWQLVRDIIGNPFRPVTLDPSWLTSTVTALAEGIYADRAFDRLPILADALQDAGCENPDVLDHCRGPGPHVRGCFVVDLLTGRK